MRRRVVCLMLTALVLSSGVSGCSNADESTGTPIDRLAEAKLSLAGQTKQAGVLVGGTDPTFEPMTFKRDGKYTGLDVELAEAIAARLGLTVTWNTVSFGDLLDQVESHQIDFSISSMFDRAARQKKADFVNYLNAGTSIVVGKGVGDIGGMAGLCGRRVAVQPETVYIDMAASQAAKCGGAKLTIIASDKPSNAVSTRAADAALNDFPIAALDVQKDPNLELSGPQIEAIPYGIGIAKDRKALTSAVQTALYSIINDGTYDGLLTKWKVSEGALRTGAINGGA